MEELSTRAQAILAGWFGFNPKSTLTLNNQESILTAECELAIAQLVKAGIINDEKADNGYAESRTYSLTKKGAKMNFKKPLEWMEENGGFQLTQTK